MKMKYVMRLMKVRQVILMLLDIILVNFGAVFALGLRFDFVIPQEYIQEFISYSFLYTSVIIMIFYLVGSYKSLWRYASIEEIISIVNAAILSMLLLYVVFTILQVQFPRSFYIINMGMLMLTTGGVRILYRVVRRIKITHVLNNEGTKVLIIGGGDAGALVINELLLNPQIGKVPIAIIDDDSSKTGRRIHGIPIKGTRKDINKVVEEQAIDEIIISIATMNKQEKAKIIEICTGTKCRLKTIPGIYEIIDGRVDIKKIRDVEIGDLLGRDPIKVDLQEISGYLENEVVLVTGGGGSIGSELCRQIAKFNPKQLIILDIYENNAYEIQQELIRSYKGQLNLEVLIASVRDKRRLTQIFEKYRPTVVFHAAAHKHVPLMEGSPTEAIKNNVFGTLNVVELSHEFGVKRFVLISTDKAVNPTNIMGATKRTAEMIIQTMDKQSDTEFVAVRFGNVLGSNGSVIPLFKKQIIEGGPVTVTHPEIIRYFMTIPEAVQLVIQAGAMAQGGEIFVLDMGKPVKILDLARNLIRLSGYEPDEDIKIEFTGLRPGEKLYEELLMEEEGLTETRHEKIFIGKPLSKEYRQFMKELHVLETILQDRVVEGYELLEVFMRKLVPTYCKEVS